MKIKNLRLSEKYDFQEICNSKAPLKTIYDIETKDLNIPKENADTYYLVIDKEREEKKRDDFSDLYKLLCANHTIMSIVTIVQKLNGTLEPFEASNLFFLNALIAVFSGVQLLNENDTLHHRYMEEPKREIDRDNYQKCKRAYQKSRKMYNQIDAYMKNNSI